MRLFLSLYGGIPIDFIDFKNKILKKKKNESRYNNISTFNDKILLTEFLMSGIELSRNILFYTDSIRKRYDFALRDLMIIIGQNEVNFTIEK